MSNRHEDEGIMDWLRNLQRRVDRLEKGDKGVRVNDTRLGDQVHTPNTQTNQIEVTNLKTGVMTPIGSIRETVWSWNGLLSVAEGLADNSSPPYAVADDTIAHEIILSKNKHDLSGCALVAFEFTGGLVIQVNITDGQEIKIRPINVAVSRNDRVSVRLVSASGNIRNLTVGVRYGQPTGAADHSNDAACS